jgi:hypothetical protein
MARTAQRLEAAFDLIQRARILCVTLGLIGETLSIFHQERAPEFAVCFCWRASACFLSFAPRL